MTGGVAADPLAPLDAAIERLDGGCGVEVFTPLDAAVKPACNANPLADQVIARFSRLARSGVDGVGGATRAADEEEGLRGDGGIARASSFIAESVESVESVQNGKKTGENRPVGFGRSADGGVKNRGSGVQNRAAGPLAPHTTGREPPAPDAAIAALRGWPPFEEQTAALAGGGLERARAERLALDDAVARWLVDHPPADLDDDRCAACGGAIVVAANDWRPLADGATVHYGAGYGLACWRRWQVMRRHAALAGLLRDAGRER